MVGTSSSTQDVLPGDMSEASSSRSRTRVRARLAVSADSGRIVVGRPGDETGPEPGKKALLFLAFLFLFAPFPFGTHSVPPSLS